MQGFAALTLSLFHVKQLQKRRHGHKLTEGEAADGEANLQHWRANQQHWRANLQHWKVNLQHGKRASSTRKE